MKIDQTKSRLIGRRGVARTVEQVAATALIAYTRYVDPVTGESIPVYDGAPPEGVVQEGPVEGTRGDLVDQLLDGVLGGN